jgi:small nuclear ribonucleoprotein (snRNP)-like protein
VTLGDEIGLQLDPRTNVQTEDQAWKDGMSNFSKQSTKQTSRKPCVTDSNGLQEVVWYSVAAVNAVLPRCLCRQTTQSLCTALLMDLPSQPSYNPTPALDRLRRLLRKTVRVTISDARIFIGSFAGTDQTLNIILISTEEYRLGLQDDPGGRYVGQVVIPWRLVTKVEGEITEADNLKCHSQSTEMYC